MELSAPSVPGVVTAAILIGTYSSLAVLLVLTLPS